MAATITFWCVYAAMPVLLWVIAGWLGSRRTVPPTDPVATRCGQCGYDVRSLPTNVCPECGSDLQVVGRRTTAQVARQRWLRRLVPIACAILMLFTAFLFAMEAMFHFSPRRQVGRMFSPQVAFIGNVEAPWPFMIVGEMQWDRDESPRVYGHWFPERQRTDRLSSARQRPTFTPTANVKADADQALSWDSLHDAWTYKSPLYAAQTGRGFPPVMILQTWAKEVVARRPPTAPLTPAELNGLIVAGGDLLASSDARKVGPQWPADRAVLVAAGATKLNLALFGGSFRNDIIPFWWPTAAVAAEWLVLAFLSLRSLMPQQKPNFQHH